MAKKQKKPQWEIEQDEDKATSADYLELIRHPPLETLVEYVRDWLPLYHEALMNEDHDSARELTCIFEAITSEAFIRGMWDFPHEWRDYVHLQRFDCYADTEVWLMDQTAAPDGEIPLWGQKGRFMIEVEGMKIDVHNAGIGWGGDSFNVIELDKPFLSETGYRSLAHSRGVRAWGYPVDEFFRELAKAILYSNGEGKTLKTPQLKGPPFGYKMHDKNGSNFKPASCNDRTGDPAYEPGGFLHEFAGCMPSAFSVNQKGQFELF